MGLDIDWDSAIGPAFSPGIHLAEVVNCEQRESRKGTLMLNLDLLGIGRTPPKRLCYDNLMLRGGGASIGTKKLQALGFSKEKPPTSAAVLIGKRVWVCVKKDDSDYAKQKGYDRLAVDISAEGSCCGYWAEDDQPTGSVESSTLTAFELGATSVETSEDAKDDDEVPF